jgi:hypothetical protein
MVGEKIGTDTPQENESSESLSDDEETEENLDSGDDHEGIQPAVAARRHGYFLEFDQGTMPKTEVIKRLAFCCLMLNVTFVTWGILQERMLTRRYPRWTGEYFTYSYALVFTNRFWTLIMSGLLILYLKPRPSRTTIIYEYSFPSISNMLSSWCQYEALRYVSFPATTLFKCFKLAPVMLMGKMLGNKSCKSRYRDRTRELIGLVLTPPGMDYSRPSIRLRSCCGHWRWNHHVHVIN